MLVTLEMWSYFGASGLNAYSFEELVCPLLDSLLKAPGAAKHRNAHVRLHCVRCTLRPYCCYLQSLCSLGLRPIPFGPSLAGVCSIIKAAIEQAFYFAGSSLDCLFD